MFSVKGFIPLYAEVDAKYQKVNFKLTNQDKYYG